MNGDHRHPPSSSEHEPHEPESLQSEQQSKFLWKTRIRIADLNHYLLCPLCNGYLIDAVTLSECGCSFCRSCLFKRFRSLLGVATVSIPSGTADPSLPAPPAPTAPTVRTESAEATTVAERVDQAHVLDSPTESLEFVCSSKQHDKQGQAVQPAQGQQGQGTGGQGTADAEHESARAEQTEVLLEHRVQPGAGAALRCPLCDVPLQRARAERSVRPDRALQVLVYKLVPLLHANETARRRAFQTCIHTFPMDSISAFYCYFHYGLHHERKYREKFTYGIYKEKINYRLFLF